LGCALPHLGGHENKTFTLSDSAVAPWSGFGRQRSDETMSLMMGHVSPSVQGADGVLLPWNPSGDRAAAQVCLPIGTNPV